MASADHSGILVNPWWLSIPLGPLGGFADGDDEVQQPFVHLNPNNESEMRGVIRQHFVPYMRRIDSDSIESLKRAYKYYLSSENIPWGGVFDSMLLPFEHPDNPRDIFLWIWEECFPNEDWRIEDFEAHTVNRDMEEPYKSIKLSRSGGTPDESPAAR